MSALEQGPAAGATRHSLTSVGIDTYGDVPVTSVIDRTGQTIGLLVGTVIDIDGGVLSGGVQFDGFATFADINEVVERCIYPLTGSFVFIVDIAGCRRIYLDADGSLSVVYDPETGRAGSTAMTLLDEGEYWQRLQTDMHGALGVGQSGWFTADITAHVGIRRLICNHCLDLDDWTAHRHWPTEPIQPATDPATVFAGVLDRVGKTVATLADAKEVSIALTAGIDSRFVLAATRSLIDRVSFVTVAAPAAKLDVVSARELAHRFGLRHDVLPYRGATPEQAEAWQIRAGHCITGANMTMHPSVEPLRGRYFVGGLGGEVGRGFLWLKADADTPIDARGIVDRLKLPRHPQVIAAVERWLEPIAHFDTLLKLDLAYLELRMSSWAFADAYANPVRTELHPMISRANFTAMLSVPPELRRSGAIFREAISRSWPELLALPINRYGDWRDASKRAIDLAANPGRAVRKIKQMVLTGPGSA
ncbi:hypothetical protein [Devosia sp.]|uniref:hypothetical protein n=1 Tax=Devosia sp. TaxID=1871048 RepID=UPI00261C2625|nr:hypothetical protein [Devosia sp.]